MTRKNDTAIAVGALIITVGILGGVLYAGRSLLPWGAISSGRRSPTPSSNNSNSNSATNASNLGAQLSTFTQVTVPSGLFNYGGSTTWAPIRRDLDSVISRDLPNFTLRYTSPTSGAPGSGTGIKMLLDNQLSFAQSSRPLTPEELQLASQRGLTLIEIPVAIDGIAIGVNPSLTLPGLTVAQLRDIYLGKLTNWQQVGGPNLPIIAYSRRLEDSGTVEFFVDDVLGKQPFGATVQFVPTTTQALRLVANNPGAIYYSTATELVPQCTIKPLPIGKTPDTLIPSYQEPPVPSSECPTRRNQLNAEAFRQGTYPITRRLFVVVKQDGQTDQQAGEAYAKLLLTEQGQQLINQTGFVSIR